MNHFESLAKYNSQHQQYLQLCIMRKDCIALKGTVKVLFGIIQDIQDLGWATQNDREYKCNVLVHFTHCVTLHDIFGGM